MCTSTASQIVRHLAQLIEDRTKIDVIEREAVEAKSFVLLLMLASAVVAPLWILDAPTALRAIYTLLAFALPATLLISNPRLISSGEPVG
jgi:cation transport ATPase